MAEAEIKPMVNQLELNPHYQQREMAAYCRKQGIVLEAWGPLMQGKSPDDRLLEEIAEKYNKSIYQICIRWSPQKGFLPIPKSVHRERIEDNFRVYDFEITQVDMDIIDTLDGGGYIGTHPDMVNF